jgi:hypothetical protein
MMKERLDGGDWLAIVGHGLLSAVFEIAGRLLQALAVVAVLLGLWATVHSLLTWLKTGAYTGPTAFTTAPAASREVLAAIDWVVVRDACAWLGGVHVLVPVALAALLAAALAWPLLENARRQSGSARDVLSRSLRDEYLAEEFMKRHRRRLVAGLLGLGLVAGLLLAWLGTGN